MVRKPTRGVISSGLSEENGVVPERFYWAWLPPKNRNRFRSRRVWSVAASFLSLDTLVPIRVLSCIPLVCVRDWCRNPFWCIIFVGYHTTHSLQRILYNAFYSIFVSNSSIIRRFRGLLLAVVSLVLSWTAVLGVSLCAANSKSPSWALWTTHRSASM